MRHLDLFSGTGGFAYAADQVWDNVEHIFCDNDKFCQQVIKKHWPEAKIYDAIQSITDTERKGWGQRPVAEKGQATRPNDRVDIVTGGFPCQPFSQAGARLGTADERHLWPEMLRVIQLTKPTWVIAENVRGLITWNDGLVFEQICSDLESSGYEVQPFIIPAVAVNAPHRRDRIWFIAHSVNNRQRGTKRQGYETQNSLPQKHRSQDSTARQPQRTISNRENEGYATNSQHYRDRAPEYDTDGRWQKSTNKGQDQFQGGFSRHGTDWERNWLEVAAELCRVDDGLPARLDGFELTKPQHRTQRLKALGNSIVPQVAIEIMKGIKLANDFELV